MSRPARIPSTRSDDQAPATSPPPTSPPATPVPSTDAPPDDAGPVGLAEQLTFLSDRLPPPPARILDAGCGRGELAVALSALGYEVTAIDTDPEAVAAAEARGAPVTRADIADHDDEPFDVVLFSLSLHHVESLSRAMARVRALLRPGGTLIADEFAWDRADHQTAAWFYDTAALLGDCHMLRSRVHDDRIADPLRRWTHRHRDEDPMHPGAVMIDAITAELELGEVTRGPYLHRYLGGFLTGDAGAGLLGTLRDIERRRVRDGTLAAVGLRLLAHRPV
ncbi:class I SAM-dependent methyltransferase [Actinomadura sp. HBU206391]|uniref:class I SAM-dependent methyltransferase n=1 Tax=Actinomadura sp. HBU206391 TaxID=2731692 RepID=UPI00165029A6|nr:class I SAM-dependent methyltransferase [Actinomadura sp. HBU206391]MBC6457348.1 class I SAM-dependent methyltransferase [Actinomadura sp. HBU206391]